MWTVLRRAQGQGCCAGPGARGRHAQSLRCYRGDRRAVPVCTESATVDSIATCHQALRGPEMVDYLLRRGRRSCMSSLATRRWADKERVGLQGEKSAEPAIQRRPRRLYSMTSSKTAALYVSCSSFHHLPSPALVLALASNASPASGVLDAAVVVGRTRHVEIGGLGSGGRGEGSFSFCFSATRTQSTPPTAVLVPTPFWPSALLDAPSAHGQTTGTCRKPTRRHRWH